MTPLPLRERRSATSFRKRPRHGPECGAGAASTMGGENAQHPTVTTSGCSGEYTIEALVAVQRLRSFRPLSRADPVEVTLYHVEAACSGVAETEFTTTTWSWQALAIRRSL